MKKLEVVRQLLEKNYVNGTLKVCKGVKLPVKFLKSKRSAEMLLESYVGKLTEVSQSLTNCKNPLKISYHSGYTSFSDSWLVEIDIGSVDFKSIFGVFPADLITSGLTLERTYFFRYDKEIDIHSLGSDLAELLDTAKEIAKFIKSTSASENI